MNTFGTEIKKKGISGGIAYRNIHRNKKDLLEKFKWQGRVHFDCLLNRSKIHFYILTSVTKGPVLFS